MLDSWFCWEHQAEGAGEHCLGLDLGNTRSGKHLERHRAGAASEKVRRGQ